MTSVSIPTARNSCSHLLLVEDDILILRTMARGLRDAGYRVSEAESGNEAIEICSLDPPDLALLDIRMPGMSGLDLAKYLAARDICFLFLTAYDNQQFVDEARGVGALGYVIKPIDVPRIIPTVETALGRARDFLKLRQNRDNIVLALEVSRELSTAVGVLSEREGVSLEEAFESLRKQARSERRKIIDVAKELLNSPAKKARNHKN